MRIVPAEMATLLRDSGLPWRVELGSRHYKVIVAGKFVTILPRSPSARNHNGSGHKNALAHVRRAIREQQRG